MFLELAILLISLVSFLHYKKKWSLPPGPFSLPLIGCPEFLWKGSKGPVIFGSEYHKYGDWYTVTMFTGRTIVILNDYQLNKELFSRDEFSGRMKTWFNANVRGAHGQTKGILTNDGQDWVIQRRFALKQLRDLGFGKKALDEFMVEEADGVIDRMLQNPNGVVKMESIFNVAVVNVLWQMIASKKFDPNAGETQEVMGMLDYIFSRANPASGGNSLLNFLRTFFPQQVPQSEVELTVLNLKDFMRKLIKEHESDIDYDNPRDFIDVYLKQIRDEPEHFDKDELIALCFDFFAAGSETTSTSLTWSMLYMVLNPEVQDKCRAEIDEQLGNKFPSIEDMSHLPYNMATLLELQRISEVAQGSLPHVLLKDVEVKGYKFKKGQIFVSNLHKLLMDPVEFPEPEKFKPERFLSKDGKSIKRSNYLVPFGIGKRICMGEALAKNEMFVFFVRILQRLTISSTNNEIPDPKNFTSRVTKVPDPFLIKVNSRNN